MYVTYVFEKLQAVTYVTHDTNKASHGGKCNFSDLFYEVKKFNIYHSYATDINVVSDIKAAASFSRPWSQFFPIQTPQPVFVQINAVILVIKLPLHELFISQFVNLIRQN